MSRWLSSEAIFAELLEQYQNTAGKKYKVNDEARDKMLSICDCVDTMMLDFGAQDIDVYWNGQNCIVRFTMNDIIFHDGRINPFFETVTKADHIYISKTEDGDVAIFFEVLNLRGG